MPSLRKLCSLTVHEAHDHRSSWLPYVCVVHGKFMERKSIRSFNHRDTSSCPWAVPTSSCLWEYRENTAVTLLWSPTLSYTSEDLYGVFQQCVVSSVGLQQCCLPRRKRHSSFAASVKQLSGTIYLSSRAYWKQAEMAHTSVRWAVLHLSAVGLSLLYR